MKIHFIGIGGIGVSALAQYYLSQKADVSGSDLVSSEITNLLKRKGAKIVIGSHNIKNVPSNTMLVIYSPAVLLNNPELKRA
ncbi:UDP-N-acetylmuramate--L-alanine ligase, partial [Patescibacteria group bacterium]|nr:UDP-N-acetylmuramate--L-alanine ligase [Patescibacteria group bacterium]